MVNAAALLSLGGNVMSLKESLSESIKLYEEILDDIRNYKQSEYKKGIAEGIEMVLEAVKVCLEEDEDCS